MRKLFSLLLLAGFLTQALAQTSPDARLLPYEQTFDGLATTSTAYPLGWQGWTIAGSLSTNFRTAAPTGDRPMVANGTAGSTTGAVYNFNGKIGFLNSGSTGDQSLALAINTTGQASVSVSYDVMTIRNPYGTTGNTRINELILQYRVGNSGTFTNLPGTEYKNNTVTQTLGTTPQNVQTKTIVLPTACENQSLVQIRWISREESGGGARPSFAVDNINIKGSSGDFKAPVANTLNPAQGATGIFPSAVPSIEFSEPVKAVAGKFMVLNDLTKGMEQKIAVDGSQVLLSANMMTLKAVLRPFRQYSISIEPGAFEDMAGNLFAGLNNWNFTTGEQQLSFDFNDCVNGLPGGFTQYSVAGALTWSCTTFGQTGSGIQLNGFRQANEDWLISPAFDLSSFNYALLSYATRSAFVGPDLELKVSTDYTGSGNPALANWTTLKGRFPTAGSDVWTTTKDINLTAFKGENVYIAFVYSSGAGSSNEASRWTLDDFKITQSATPPVPDFTFAPSELDFDYQSFGGQSPAQQVIIEGYNLQGDLLVTAPDGFEVSIDNVLFGKTAVLKQPDAESNELAVFVRFSPGAANQEFAGTLAITSSGIDKQAAKFTGTSLRALKIVNWNIEWFGSPLQTPSNDNLQQQNVQTVLTRLNADVYALSEIVDTPRLAAVVASMPGYAYTISDFGSYTEGVDDPDYASAQKLAFVYRSDVVKKLEAYGVLRSGGSDDAFRNWSSGRYPYLMKADVVLEGVETELNLVLLHGKANTGNASEQIESWHRRKNGAAELKDSLDKYYPYSNVVILGDFNDDLDQTIAPSIPGNVSSYIDFLNAGAAYKPLTLPLSLAGQRSTVSHDNVIDHQMASNEMGVAYVPGSARIATQVASWVSSYGASTSDHYPVVARYDLRFFASPIDLTRFDGVVDGNKVVFGWSTAHEINSRYFVVERSRNGKDFEAVDSLAGAGDSRKAVVYNLNYGKPWPGQSHYRLRSVSLDGSIYYSDVLTINMKSNSHLLQVNTASRSEAVLAYRTGARESAMVQLYDLNGRMYFQKQVNFEKGSNIRRIDTRHLPAGVYLVRVLRASGSETAKVFIGK